MTKFTKFLVGVGATSLLAWGAHAMTGENYIAGLESRASAALQGGDFAGVDLAMARDPLARVAVLSGITDPAARARAEAAVLAVPGISAVRWADAAAADAAAAPAASVAEVAACQQDVDATMQGKVITFNSGSAYMPDSSLAVVDEVANAIRDCAGMAIAVEGHTDASGSAEVNQTLSQARADAVSAALATRGIAADRISATGFGSSQPVTPGDGYNAANRRIEFKLGAGAAAAAPAEGE